MSAGTDLSQPLRARLFRGTDLLTAGWAALTAVALSGLTLGFFGWYAVIVPNHHGVLGEAGLLAGTVGGIALAVAAWLGYSAYFARRAQITPVAPCSTMPLRGCRSSYFG